MLNYTLLIRIVSTITRNYTLNIFKEFFIFLIHNLSIIALVRVASLKFDIETLIYLLSTKIRILCPLQSGLSTKSCLLSHLVCKNKLIKKKKNPLLILRREMCLLQQLRPEQCREIIINKRVN